MTRSDFEELHGLLDRFDDAASGTVLVPEDECELALSDLRAEIVKHVERIEQKARRAERSLQRQERRGRMTR